MLTVCVEAGQGFDAALLQVARTVDGPDRRRVRPRALGDPDRQAPAAEAFAGHGRAHHAPEVKTFVSALVQADRLGLPIAAVLREQTKEMRLVRRQRAEEKAQKVTVKILFPLLLLHLPGAVHRRHRPRRHPHHGDVRRVLTGPCPTRPVRAQQEGRYA